MEEPAAAKKFFYGRSISPSLENRAISSTPLASTSSTSGSCHLDQDIGGSNLMADLGENERNAQPASSLPSFKRWNSMPMGINFNYCMRCPEPSPSSSSSSEEDEANDSNNSDAVPPLTNIERKSASFCVFDDRRPKSASSGGYVIRHRSASNALYLPYRLLDKGIEKLKREANIRSCIETDYAGEKMSITGAAIMYSMDEFSIAEGGQAADSSSGILEQRRRTQSLTEPVHVLTNLLPASCSPSPTRNERQWYSPSLQQVVRNVAMSPTPSPSPTRRQCIRSLSPIALRTGMGLKRKCDVDGEGYPTVLPKRANYSVPTTPSVAVTENQRTPALFNLASLTSQSLNHSLSESSIDSECSGSSDHTNVSSASQAICHHHYPLLSNTIAGSPIASTLAAARSSVEDYPPIEEAAIDEA